MSNKTLAIVSYITIIGWLIAYFSYKGQPERNALVHYHLEQSLGLFIVSVVLYVAATILISVIPALAILATIIGVLQLILLIMGIINAANEAFKPVPVVGRFFEKKFSFLS